MNDAQAYPAAAAGRGARPDGRPRRPWFRPGRRGPTGPDGEERGLLPHLSARAKRRVAPLLALVALVAIVVGAIWVSSVNRRQVHLDDGTVWVTSLKDRKAARFNVKLGEADVAVSSAAARFDVGQHDSDTMITEGPKATSILASTVAADTRTETKGDTTATVGGDTVAFLSTKTGDVWAGRTAKLDAVAPSSADPAMSLGTGGKVAVRDDGTVFGYRPADGMVLRMDDPTSGKSREVGSLSDGQALAADDFTVVGDVPVVISDGTFHWRDGKTNASAPAGTTDRLTLQSPSTDGRQAGWVAASGPHGLSLANLDDHGGAQARTIETGGSGEPAKPVSTDGCVYAAWSQQASNYLRVCGRDGTGRDGKDAKPGTLQDVDPTSDLVFRTNHRLVLLNDVANGNVWNPADDTNVIKIQWNTMQTEQTTKQSSDDRSANNQREFAKACSADSGAIKAVDDTFGARAGSGQILDVLRNDEQTDCSVLRIGKVGAPSGADVTVSPVYDGRYLQLDASKAAAGTATFSYEIDDGRGQTSSATVTVDLTGADGNAAPTQSDTPAEHDVEQGATMTVNALGGFTDPDGDPLTLVSATPSNSGQVVVSTRSDGQLVFNAGSATSGRVGVELTVSDGQATGTGMVYFSIRPANTLPASIDAVTKRTTPGTRTTVSLKPYVHGTSAQPAVLSAVDTPDKTSVTMNAADLSFTFQANDPGTYYVPYTITQGTIPAVGLARLEVAAVGGEAAKPVAANDVALLGADGTAIVEPLSNDVDPTGGVLSVTSVNADATSGIKTGLVSHKRVYMTARRVPEAPVRITYTVANAAGSSTGTIVLQPPSPSAASSTPKAGNVNAQVRAGGIVSVDVLDHVSHADGTTITLGHDLQTDKATFKGLAFVSGTTVRYQAGEETGSYPITYTVTDNLGNSASGTITVAVHAKDAAHKAAPTPKDVDAQVAAGSKVRIPITLTGIDADGDDDQLLGLGNKAPTMGRITEVGSDYMVYEAYPDSAGTDVFSYAVEDWTGQRAQAQMRVGVFQGASDSGVYARDDTIALRPDTAATVPVTINDISGDNTELKVDPKVEAQGIDDVKVKDNMVSFTTPSKAGTAYVVYTVADKAGLSDTATLTIDVDPKAPIEPPDAYDYRVPAAATIDKRSVDVDVSQWIANPSGTASELAVDVDESASDHARVKGGKGSTVITVDLTDEARSVPYTVTNTTYDITSTAFIQVPAYGVFPPVLRPKAPEIKVNAGESVDIPIADHVRVGAGKTAYIESKDSVSATKSDGSDLVKDDVTLRFTAAKDYSGPASITFTAVDAKPGSGARIVNSAVLTLPVTVVGKTPAPPTFSSSTIDVVAGESAKTIDLTALTHPQSGSQDDTRGYAYSSTGAGAPVDAQVTREGQLTVSAAKDATPGVIVSVPIAIDYGGGTVNAGVTVRVTGSNRPLARVGDQTVRVKAGETTQVDVLAGAFNPFPDDALTMVSCTGQDPTKLTVSGCPGSGPLTVSAAAGAGASTNTVVVTVQDGTKSKDRQVSATITVSLTDRPDPPLVSPVSGAPLDSAVNLSWTAGNANGSPIDNYQVQWNDGGAKDCGAVTTCQITGLTNGHDYTFTVRAHNEVGWSDPSTPVTARPDKAPEAPGGVRAKGGYHEVTVGWDKPEGDASAPEDYTVTLVSAGGSPRTQTVEGLSATFQLDDADIPDGSTFTATVTARNAIGSSQPSDGATAKPWGTPDAPTVSLTKDGDNLVATITPTNMRNATCQTIVVTGAISKEGGCSGTSFTRTITPADYYQTLMVSGRILTDDAEHPSPEASSNELPIDYAVPRPTEVTSTRSGDQCTVSWKSTGESDGFDISIDGLGTQSGNAPVSFTLQPWQTCGAATVTQNYKGHRSDGATGGPAKDPVYKVSANISLPQVSWKDKDTVTIAGGSVDTYGQGVKALQIILNDGSTDHPLDWSGQPGDINVSDLGDAGYGKAWTYRVKVTGQDSGLDKTSDQGTTTNNRPEPEKPKPTEPEKPDPGTDNGKDETGNGKDDNGSDGKEEQSGTGTDAKQSSFLQSRSQTRPRAQSPGAGPDGLRRAASTLGWFSSPLGTGR